MNNERLKEVIKQVLYNPQVISPPISYEIIDKGCGDKGEDYTSKYMDVKDFDRYVKDLEKQLIYRLKD